MKHYTFEEVWYMDAGVVTGDNNDLRAIIAELLTCVPSKVVEYVMDKCLILSLWEEEKVSHVKGATVTYRGADGGYIPNELIGDKDIILISERVLNGDRKHRDLTILHEVAHCWRRHKSGFLHDQSREEIERQEDEAQTLAHRWYRRHSKRK